jgi:hypothetical protein
MIFFFYKTTKKKTGTASTRILGQSIGEQLKEPLPSSSGQ